MKTALVVLAGLLLLSNAFWIYRTFDSGVTLTYMEISLQDNQQALEQALAIIKASAPATPRQTIIKAAQLADTSKQSFEKDGYVWTGKLGLRFSSEGKLLEAVPAWQ